METLRRYLGRAMMAACALTFCAVDALGQETKTAAELGIGGMPPETRILVLESDPNAVPAEPTNGWLTQPVASISQRGMGQSDFNVNVLPVDGDATPRAGCPDEGYTTRAYARDSGNDWPWIPANTLVADDLTLKPGNWVITCYDVLIRADNSPYYGCNINRTVTLRAYDACNGNLIPGSEDSWTVPPYGGPILLTGVTNIHFQASGTIWFGLTTTSNECDGWYLGQQQYEGSTQNRFQYITDCNACINPPSCNPWAGFIVVLYACNLPIVDIDPANAEICQGQYHQFCTIVSGAGPFQYQWQSYEDDILGATQPCYIATSTSEYRCKVTNSCGSVYSDPATLVVRTGPTITQPPADAQICHGDEHEFCVESQGMGNLTYQWKRNGLSQIGAIQPCFTASTAGSYTCVVTDDCGPTVSAAGVLSFYRSVDVNGDTMINSADIDEFVDVLLLGESATPAQIDACDMNENGVANGEDISLFVTCYLAAF